MDNNFSKSSNEWSDVCLDKFIKVKHGYAFKGKYITTEETPHILVTPGNFHIGGGFKSNKFKYYTDDYPEEYILKNGDIVVTMTDLSKESDTLGYSAKIPNSLNGKKYLHNQRIGLVEFKNEDIEPDFAYWLMRTRDYQGFIVGSASGTSIMHTSPTRICEYEFKLPPLPEQKAIAEVLSSLDDKIDLLHRQNETLEQMAQTLFRQWFVVEADDSWEELDFGTFLMPQKGKNLTRAKAIDGVFPVVAGGLEPMCTHNEANTEAPVITISASGANAGFIRLYNQKVWSSDSSFIDKTITPYVYFSYMFLKFNQNILFDRQTGSAQPHIYPKQIMELEFRNYPERLIDEFEKRCEDFFNKIGLNQHQIQTLEKLRDSLLPKLMSGEVRVNS